MLPHFGKSVRRLEACPELVEGGAGVKPHFSTSFNFYCEFRLAESEYLSDIDGDGDGFIFVG